ncbi:MAG: hypothetical protein ACP5NZ_02790 [Nanobdellota archaeon]
MKKGRKTLYFVLAFVIILVLASSVFAQSLGLSGTSKEAIEKVMDGQGIDKDKIKSVEKVDFEDLPEQVDLKNIDTTNLAVYEVDYGGNAPVFVVTASDELLETPEQVVQIYKMMLNFGLKGENSGSFFLDSATGVEGSKDKGYVMMREGSITGLSTNLEVLSGEGTIEVMVYINGELASFSNTIIADSTGVKKDYDIQSLNIVKFDKGDTISVYVKTEGNVIVKDIINLVEISTE